VLQKSGKTDQHFIASCVPVGVVGFLEVVDVQKDDAERSFEVTLFAFGELEVEPLFELASPRFATCVSASRLAISRRSR
jgi:hypothetical protein